MRMVRTASAAVAVQLVTRHGRQLPGIEQVRSAHTDEELALLLAAAKARLMPGRDASIGRHRHQRLRLNIDPELPVVAQALLQRLGQDH